MLPDNLVNALPSGALLGLVFGFVTAIVALATYGMGYCSGNVCALPLMSGGILAIGSGGLLGMEGGGTPTPDNPGLWIVGVAFPLVGILGLLAQMVKSGDSLPGFACFVVLFAAMATLTQSFSWVYMTVWVIELKSWLWLGTALLTMAIAVVGALKYSELLHQALQAQNEIDRLEATQGTIDIAFAASPLDPNVQAGLREAGQANLPTDEQFRTAAYDGAPEAYRPQS
jgi:hypothetical protein